MPPIILQELLPPNYAPGRRVELAEHNMPAAGIVESRELQLTQQVFPGSSYLDTQIMGLKDDDLTLTGWLRDAWNTGGFARAARQQLLALQQSGNPLWLSWGDTWGRAVLLRKVEFTHEVQGQRYSLTLTHLELAEQPTARAITQSPENSLLTLDQVMVLLVEIQRLPLPETVWNAHARTAAAKIQALARFTARALTAVEDAISVVEIATSTLHKLRAQLDSAQQQAAALRTLLGATDFGPGNIPLLGEAVLATWRWQTRLVSLLTALNGGLLEASALLKTVRTTPLRRVVVRDGDTLQGIAARELGDFRRWSELASLNRLSPGQLLPGYLEVPA